MQYPVPCCPSKQRCSLFALATKDVCSHVHRLCYRAAGKLNGWGFVQFASQEAAERACQLEDVNFMGRDLFIGPAGQKAEDRPSGEPVQGCWFCLSSQTADTSLIVSIGTPQSRSDGGTWCFMCCVGF